MRDIIIILVIIVAVFGGSFFVDKKLENTGQNLIKNIELVQQEVETNQMNDMSTLNDFKVSWDNCKNILNILTNHQAVDEIDIELNKLIKNYEMKDEVEALMNIIEIKTMLDDMHKGESFTLTNIL